MTIYAYKCKICGGTRDDISRHAHLLCCDSPMGRDYRSVSIGSGCFTPHFNYATGKYVSTDREFRDALKRTAEDNSNLTGIEHSYSPIYPDEMKTMVPKTSTEAIEQSNKGFHDKATSTGEYARSK